MAFDDLSNAQLELITKLAQKLATGKFRPEFRVLTGLMSAGPEIHLVCVDGELVEPPIEHFRESTLDVLKEKGYVTLIPKGTPSSHRFIGSLTPQARQQYDLHTSLPLADMASTQSDIVLIVTVTKIEALAVLEVFNVGEKRIRRPIGNKTYYDLGVHGGASVFMVQSEAGIATPGGALLTVRQAIQYLQPQAVIMCGTAFGLRPDKQKLGDILITTKLHYYGPQKVDLQHGQIPRGDRVTVSERLLDRFRSGDLEWEAPPQTHFGLVLSGETLVNDPGFRDWLLEIEPEALGGEMEGAGLYAAAKSDKVDWIMVKAICDWADGMKNDEAQPLAAQYAAKFVLGVLQLGSLGGREQKPSKKPDPSSEQLQSINVYGDVPKSTELSNLPKLTLKLFVGDDGPPQKEITFFTHRSLTQVHVFGFELENTEESSLAKGVSTRISISWRGDPPSVCPCIEVPFRLKSEGWLERRGKVGKDNQPATLIFRDPNLTCSHGIPVAWCNFKLHLSEHLDGYLLIQYQVSSNDPQTHNSDELRMTLRNG